MRVRELTQRRDSVRGVGVRAQRVWGAHHAMGEHDLEDGLLVPAHDRGHIAVARGGIHVEHPRHRQRAHARGRLHLVRHDQVNVPLPRTRTARQRAREAGSVDVGVQRMTSRARVCERVCPAMFNGILERRRRGQRCARVLAHRLQPTRPPRRHHTHRRATARTRRTHQTYARDARTRRTQRTVSAHRNDTQCTRTRCAQVRSCGGACWACTPCRLHAAHTGQQRLVLAGYGLLSVLSVRRHASYLQ
jgi:hypothetical protein